MAVSQEAVVAIQGTVARLEAMEARLEAVTAAANVVEVRVVEMEGWRRRRCGRW